MRPSITRIFTVLSLIFIFILKPVFSQGIDEKKIVFNVKLANQQFDRLNLNLSLHGLDSEHLSVAIKTISNLNNEANICIKEAKLKLQQLNQLGEQENVSPVEGNKEAVDSVYLSSERKKISDQLSQCRLFSIRAKEALNSYQRAFEGISKRETLSKGLPLWLIPYRWSESPIFTWPNQSLADTQLPQHLSNPWVLIISLLGAAIMAKTLLFFASRPLKSMPALAIKLNAKTQIITITFSILATAFLIDCFIFNQNISKSSFLVILSAYVLLLSFGTFLISALDGVSQTLNLKKFSSWNFNHLKFVCLGALYFAISLQIIPIVQSLFNVNQELIQLVYSVYLYFLLFFTRSCIHYFCKDNSNLKFIIRYQNLLKSTLGIIFIIFAFCDFIGYHNFAFRLAMASIKNLSLLFIGFALMDLLSKIEQMLYETPSLAIWMTDVFNHQPGTRINECLILRIMLQIVVLSATLLLMASCWGFLSLDLARSYQGFLYGFQINRLNFVPAKMISGIIVYCLIYLLFRAISRKISQNQNFDGEEERQVAVASIIIYLGFSIALFTALIISGIDFTGLTIIAGALSVGIGLGFQSIVNNIVSGLILLIEKPFKPGDRISVDGIEGFVKKIRVRSTQILTPAKEDIIIPNSDLVTKKVINYMYSDKYCRIQCDVGVAYDSSVALVKDLLLQAANVHDEVIKTGRSKPVVLFYAFGRSALLFSLFVTIKDVNKKGLIQSDLNALIMEFFRAHQIKMGLPQRELLLKSNKNLNQDILIHEKII